jgi:1-acyl-sn-glycerol-3-phosphate acyltransferase
MFGFLPAQFRILAKQTLFLIPFLGWHLYLAGNVPIDRRNPVRAFQSVYRASYKIRQGLSLLVFLEGTRSRDGKLKRFKRGTFTLAKKLNVPIVPVAVRGTFDLMPAGSWLAKPGRVELTILPPVVVSEEMENQVIASNIRRQLLAAGLQEG